MSNIAYKNSKSELKFVYSENNALSIIFQNNDILIGIVGEFNNNLKELEKITETKIYSRGNSILVKSDPEKNHLVKNAIEFLTNQFLNNGTIEKKDIISSVNKFMINEKYKKSEKNIEYIIKTPKKSVIPRSEKQKNYVRALKESDIVISAGPAGTGKTFLAVAVALTMLLDKKIEKIILSRPAVEAGETLGYLPGDLKEKLDPYLQPLYDGLRQLISKGKLNRYLDDNVIEILPLGYMRGRTLNNSFVILDEGQNVTKSQMKMFLTRMGLGSKFVVTGDITQIDLSKKSDSSLHDTLKVLKNIKGVNTVLLDHSDNVRHKLVSEIINKL